MRSECSRQSCRSVLAVGTFCLWYLASNAAKGRDKPKLLIVAIDGIDRALLYRMLRAGELPETARLLGHLPGQRENPCPNHHSGPHRDCASQRYAVFLIVRRHAAILAFILIASKSGQIDRFLQHVTDICCDSVKVRVVDRRHRSNGIDGT